MKFSIKVFFSKCDQIRRKLHSLCSENILKRFHYHPSLIKIKQLVNNQAKFSFQPVSVHIVKEVIERLPSNKTTAGEIPFKILK